jgi:hypothetical protein
VFTRTMRALVFGTALALVSAAPAAAQTVGVGISFLGNNGGTGLQVDYAARHRTLSGGERTLDFVGDFSVHHNGFGNDLTGVKVGFTSFFIQGGARVNGSFDPKFKWFVQGLVGVHHLSVGTDAAGVNKDICDAFNIDCSTSAGDTGVVVTPGGAVTYALNERTSLRGQLDIPIGNGGGTTRFFLGISRQLGK